MPQLRAPERRTWADDVRPLHLVSHVSRTTPTRDAMAMLWDGSPKVDGHALSGKRVMHQQFLGVLPLAIERSARHAILSRPALTMRVFPKTNNNHWPRIMAG